MGILVLMTNLGEHVVHAFPHEQQLPTALKEELFVQHTAGDERSDHVPVGDDHPERRVLVRSGRRQLLKLVPGLHFEVRGEPRAGLAHALLAPHLE